jgi:type II secretion system protein H
MTSATGQPSERRHRRGFTLIELVLVLALLVIAVSMVAPRISGFIRGRALHSEARRLLSVIRAGQSRAVSEGMPASVWIQSAQGRYGLASETPASSKADPKEIEFTTDEEIRLSVTAGTGESVTFRELPAIRWLPDGVVDEGSPKRLELKDSAGATLWLVESTNRRGYEIRDSNN